MGENATKIGQRLEGWGSNIFSDMAWKEVTRDLEIACTRKGVHKKRTHGIDLLLEYTDPYLGVKQGIIVECKNRQMRSITLDDVNEWVLELQNLIECSHSAPELKRLNFDSEISTGLLLVHANDVFDAKRWREILRAVQVKIKRTRMSIYIASNIQIDMWQSVINYIHKKDGTLSFVYPSINESNPRDTNYITVNFLFSKYIFAEQLHKVEGTGSNGYPITEYKRNRIVFSFDDIAVESFQYLWSMFKKFQFTDHLVEKYIFVFFPRGKDDVKFVNDNLIKSLENGITPPITQQDKEKIHIEFLENRYLSPVDN